MDDLTIVIHDKLLIARDETIGIPTKISQSVLRNLLVLFFSTARSFAIASRIPVCSR